MGNDLLQIAISLILGGAGYKFLALAYNNKFRQKDLQMDIITELRAEVKELRDRVENLQGQLDTCKTDFYELMEKHLGIIKD
jgi:Tfp pilus assembly protein PilO